MQRSARRTAVSAWLPGAVLFFSALITLCCWALASPPGSSPDDNYHLSSIWCAQGTSDLCQKGAGPTWRVLPTTVVAASCYAPDATASAVCQDTFPETLVADLPTERGNWNGGYPPVFYELLSVFAGDHLVLSVLSMRFANCLLAVVLLGATALAVPRQMRALVLVPITLVSMPITMYFLASTNPSSWTLLGLAILWPALYAAFDTSGRRRGALLALAVVAATMASGSRTDASLFVVFVIGVVALLRVRELRANLLVVATAVLCLAISAWFFLRAGQSVNVLIGFGDAVTEMPADQRLFLNLKELPILLMGGFGFGFMGTTGWLDTTFPSTTAVTALGCWAALLFLWSREPSARKVLATALVGVSLLAYPLFMQTRSHLIIGQGFQPRYLLPLLIVFTGVFMLRGRRTVPRLTRLQLGVVVGALSVGHLLALQAQIRRYVTGLDITDVNLDADREWWWDVWFSPNVVWLVGSAAFAVTVYLVLRLLREPVDELVETVPAPLAERQPVGK